MNGVVKGMVGRARQELIEGAGGLIDAAALQGAQSLAEALGVYVGALRDLLISRSTPEVEMGEAGDWWFVSADPAVVRVDAVLADLTRLGDAFPDPPVCRVCGCTDSRACWFECYWVEEAEPNPAGPICSACQDQVGDSADEPVDKALVRALAGLGLTQQRIAAAVGVTQGRVSQILSETQEGL